MLAEVYQECHVLVATMTLTRETVECLVCPCAVDGESVAKAVKSLRFQCRKEKLHLYIKIASAGKHALKYNSNTCATLFLFLVVYLLNLMDYVVKKCTENCCSQAML